MTSTRAGNNLAKALQRRIVIHAVLWGGSSLLGVLMGPLGLVLVVAVVLMLLVASGGGYTTTAAAAATPVGYSCPTTTLAAPANSTTPTVLTPASTSVLIPTATTSAATPDAGAALALSRLPYQLPATTGTTGEEETVNAAGQVPSTGGKVTWSKFAALGIPYQKYYITMRWNYVAWNFDGTAADVDEKQYEWFATGHDGGRPWMVTATNPRTHKSVNLAVIEAGPGPWVGVTDADHSAKSDAAQFGWTNPLRGTPPNWTGIVSGMPRAAITTIGAITGYLGQRGDKLVYQWAANQNATPGPTGAAATAPPAGDTPVTGCSSITDGGSSNCAAPVPPPSAVTSTSGQAPRTTRPPETVAQVTVSTGTVGCGGVIVNGVSVTIPTKPDVDPAVAGHTITAPNAAVAKGLAVGLATVGMPYVYGGGTDNGPPDEGCGRAGGSENSCQGIVGLDCSGLTGYVLKTAGVTIPTNSSGQRGGGSDVPFSRGVPGDIMGFSGHVAIYLGFIDGVQYLLEAPTVGMNVHIRKIYWSNDGVPADSMLHRYWS